MDFANSTVKFSEIKQQTQLAELYSKIYTIPKKERVKVLMSWLANAYSDLLIPFLPAKETLNTYIVHTRLLDTFANNSAYDIVAQLASEFSENFLALQVIPNLLENYEKTADITYFIQILCQNLTCPSLIRKVMDIVTSRLTPIFIGRMLSDNHLIATSTLSLLKSLLEFYCEDLWYDLILQYLLPMKHLLTSQRQKMLPDIEFHESTSKLLELIPQQVGDTINPSILTDHFLQYFQDEVSRLHFIESAVATSLPSSRSELYKAGLVQQSLMEEPTSSSSTTGQAQPSSSSAEEQSNNRSTGRNPTYPMWIFKYDGTDFLHALRRGFFAEEPEEFFEDDLFSETNQLNSSSTSDAHFDNEDDSESQSHNDILSRSQLSNDENHFELANVSELGLDGDGSLPVVDSGADSLSGFSSINSNGFVVKDKRKSMQSLDSTDCQGIYFGPFLQSIYEILKQWAVIHPDVLFLTTEIISVLASSRIPLINTLFLDMSLTLQPSYPAFSSLLHTIKQDLDISLRKCPDQFFRNVWKSAARESSLNGGGIPFLTGGGDDNSSSGSASLINTLRRTIASNRSFRMTADEADRTIGRRGSSFRAFTDIFKPSSREGSKLSDFRLLNRTSSPFDSEEEENIAKVMALRSVLFTHWLLELGAIALQLCWGKKCLEGTCNNNTKALKVEKMAKLSTGEQQKGDTKNKDEEEAEIMV